MNLPSYPGQPGQPEQPAQPEQPGQQPPPPPASPQAPQAPQAPSYPAAPSYPSGAGAVPPPPPVPPAPPGGPVPPAFPPYQAYAGPNDGGTSYSGVAIASLVCSVTCCLGIPGVILGIVGITKTGAGKARGRWMAVTGIILGLIGTGLIAAAGLGLLVLGQRVVTPTNAEVGQCVAVETEGDEVVMFDTGCTLEHNGQIFAVLTPTEADVAARRPGIELCATRLAGVFPDARLGQEDGTLDIGDDLVRVGAVGRRTEIEAGSPIVCWIEATDGVLAGDHVD